MTNSPLKKWLSFLSLPILFLIFGFALKNEASKEKERGILAVLRKYQLAYDIDASSVSRSVMEGEKIVGIDKLQEKIQELIASHKPITFRMVGFPIKSINAEGKVLSSLPDMAERQSLVFLQKMLEEIGHIYSEGARLVIVCDGIAFADILGITEKELLDYENGLKVLIKDLPNISLITSKELLLDGKLHGALKQSTAKPCPVGLEPEVDLLSKRLEKDLLCKRGRNLLASQHETKKTLATKVLNASLCFSQFVKDKYASDDAILASVHFQKDVSKKIGLKLSPTSEITPWHGVCILEKNGQFSIVHKSDIDPKKYELQGQYIHGYWCSYYQAH